jgi:predicted deacetylase
VNAGDSVAQHGFQHRQTRPAGLPRQLLARVQGGHAAEFPGLDPDETQRAVHAGLRVLRAAGVAPHGFVAPAYAYTGALREVLTATFDWWASVWSVHDRNGGNMAPALGLGTSGPVRRALSPPLVRAGALVPSRTIRLDLHPADFDHPRHVLALEWVLRRAHRHTPITYDDLAHAG